MADESIPSGEKPKRLTIAELEKLLDIEEETSIEILPNGEIRATNKSGEQVEPKPLTMREYLGGEY